MSVSTRRFAVATLLTGIIAGLVGLACIHLLHWIQAIAWDMHGSTLWRLSALFLPPGASGS